MTNIPQDAIIIVGGGHAAAQLCVCLSQAGLGARTVLVCEEPQLPYHRPPLSKAFLKNTDESLLPHRPAAWYEQAGITVVLGDPAIHIDRQARLLQLRSGRQLSWRKLVLATGTRARTLPALSGASNVAGLRDASDAERLRKLLIDAEHIAILGGGFIGLEIAATAHAQGKQVTVLEASPRVMARAASPALSEHVLAQHRANGLDIRVQATVTEFEIEGKVVNALRCGDDRLPLDLLVLGIGAAPETSLAVDAGLDCDDGILVDTHMRTNDPDILAIGDCARFPDWREGVRRRLESVQNANDQAKTACATLTDTPAAYDALPWFWSEQGTLRLQMAGLPPSASTDEQLLVRRQSAKQESFSLFHYQNSKLICVESVNAPLDHVASRKLLELGISPPPEAVLDSSVPLKSFIPTAPSPAA